jgi:hypothetical protein
LLAKAACQSPDMFARNRVRQQAGSYRFASNGESGVGHKTCRRARARDGGVSVAGYVCEDPRSPASRLLQYRVVPTMLVPLFMRGDLVGPALAGKIPGPTMPPDAMQVLCRSRLAGEGGVSVAGYVSWEPRSPASRLLQYWAVPTMPVLLSIRSALVGLALAGKIAGRTLPPDATQVLCRSRLAGEGGVSVAGYVSWEPGSPASWVLQYRVVPTMPGLALAGGKAGAETRRPVGVNPGRWRRGVRGLGWLHRPRCG